MQYGLAGFEEHLDFPAFAVDAQNFFWIQADICAEYGNPVLPIVPIADADDPGRYCIPLHIRKQDVNRQEIPGTPAPFPAYSEDLLEES